MRLTVAHTPDADDAFMFCALAQNRIETEGLQFEHILQDIETLNQRAARSERVMEGFPSGELTRGSVQNWKIPQQKSLELLKASFQQARHRLTERVVAFQPAE